MPATRSAFPGLGIKVPQTPQTGAGILPGKEPRIFETARRHAVWVKRWHRVPWGVSDTRSGVENEVIFCCRGAEMASEIPPIDPRGVSKRDE